MSATAHAKFILSGEHFVVHGAKCVIMPVQCFSTRISFKKNRTSSGTPRFVCSFENNVVLQTGEIELYQKHVERLTKKLCTILCAPADTLEGLECTVQSSIPPGQGAGSSSALSYALVDAMLEFLGRYDVGRPYRDFYSQQLENSWHGPVSGCDNIAVSRSCPVMFKIGEEPLLFLPQKNVQPIYYVVGSTGPRRSPEKGFTSLKTLKVQEPRWFAHLIEASDAISDRVMTAMDAGDGKTIGACFAESQALLEQIGVSTPEILSALRAARQAGAYGAKLTGAGCGGFVIACCPENRIQRIKTAWQKLGLTSICAILSAPIP